MSTERTLWARSTAWRWLFVLTCLTTAIVILLKPWESSPSFPLGVATYKLPPSIQVNNNQTTAVPSAGNQSVARQKTIQAAGTKPEAITFSVGTELHAIGVYKSAEKPWWMNCPSYTSLTSSASNIDTAAELECHSKYAGIKSEPLITVNVSRTGMPIVLALMAYESVIWNIVSESGADIQRIIIAGYHEQEVKGVSSNIPIDMFTHKPSLCENCSYYSDYFYAYEKGTTEYKNTVFKLNSYTGLSLSSFQTARELRLFYIPSTSQQLDKSTVTPSFPAKVKFLPTPRSNDYSDVYTGKYFRNQLMIENKVIPLPTGRWLGVGYENFPFSRGTDEVVVLVKLNNNNELDKMIAIRLQTVLDGNGSPKESKCERNDYHSRVTDINEAFGEQICFWINHTGDPWSESILNLAASNLKNMGVTLPKTLINAGFIKKDKQLFVLFYSYSNPELKGIITPRTAWGASPWHPFVINNSPERVAAIKDYSQTAKDWFPIFKTIQ